MIFKKRNYKKGMATASFAAAVVLAYVGKTIHPEHDIAAGVILVIAQLLILRAILIDIDHKLNNTSSSHKA